MWLPWQCCCQDGKSCFNPHIRTGCDLRRVSLFSSVRGVSIHTSVQDVTSEREIYALYSLLCFNPHIRTGCDAGYLLISCGSFRFQSTHPYRMWQVLRHLEVTYQFQSTHPYRMWRASQFMPANVLLFQSTHPYRMWPWGCGGSRDSGKVSIHTSVQDVTTLDLRWVDQIAVSIHTSVQDVTSSTYDEWCPDRGFNPHIRTGCDLFFLSQCFSISGFNPHIRTGCDSKPLINAIRSPMFQSTHPYRMWQPIPSRQGTVAPVSIHTSVQDVTRHALPQSRSY